LSNDETLTKLVAIKPCHPKVLFIPLIGQSEFHNSTSRQTYLNEQSQKLISSIRNQHKPCFMEIWRKMYINYSIFKLWFPRNLVNLKDELQNKGFACYEGQAALGTMSKALLNMIPSWQHI